MSAETEIAAMQSRLLQLERIVESLRANSGRQVTRMAIGGGSGGGGFPLIVKDTKAELDAVVNQYTFPYFGAEREFENYYVNVQHRHSLEEPPTRVWVNISHGLEFTELEMPPISLNLE